jgi:hypothetical protein
MVEKNNKNLECFSKLDIVFPMEENGLRNTPETCFNCLAKTECLRTAIKGANGLKVEEETLDRAYTAGRIGFWKRWSKKKSLKRNRQKSIL